MRDRQFVSRQLASIKQMPEDQPGRADAIERLTKELAAFPAEEAAPSESSEREANLLDQVLSLSSDLTTVNGERDRLTAENASLRDQLAQAKAKAKTSKPAVAKAKAKR